MQVFTNDPRNIAIRAEEYMRSTGIADESRWGPEFEFYIFDSVSYEYGVNRASYRVDCQEADWTSVQSGHGHYIPVHGGYHAIPPKDQFFNLRTEMSLAPAGDGCAGQIPPPRGGWTGSVRDRDPHDGAPAGRLMPP